MEFPCTGCGVCCKRAGKAVEAAKALIEKGITDGYVKEMAAFPWPYDETGRCSQLRIDNDCAVYPMRPDICNVKKMWEKYQSHAISQQDYFTSAAMLCNEMMVEDNVDTNFFINTDGKESSKTKNGIHG